MTFRKDTALKRNIHKRLDVIANTLGHPTAALDAEDINFLSSEKLLVTAGRNNAMDRGLTLNAVRQRKANLLVTMARPVPNVQQGAQKGLKAFAFN